MGKVKSLGRKAFFFIKQRVLAMTLFQKMLFFYVIILCIPTLLIGMFYVRSLSRRLNEEYVKSRQERLEQVRVSIENAMMNVSSCMSVFQYNSSLLQYVEEYDFSTAEGAVMWMEDVHPAFEQINTAFSDFSRICVWRVKKSGYNDPRFVLNASDNEDFEQIGTMNYKSVKLFLENGGQSTSCRLYRALFNTSGFHIVGYAEVDCDFEYLFSALGFLEEDEMLLIRHGQENYRVMVSPLGRLYLEPFDEGVDERLHKTSTVVDSLQIELHYYYPDLTVYSNSTLVSMVMGAVLLFIFFTAVYYAFYMSITRRVTKLTEHMLIFTEERMQRYKDDPNGDEIGSMVCVYNKTVNRVNQLIDEIVQKERLVNQAQYYAMQSQIQPHFLYNTLENIDMLIEVGANEKASGMMAVFGKILRYNLSRHQELATVEEEICHIEDYLRLYSYRMGDDFCYSIEMEPDCRKAVCPYCMMQPVVENCFKHGFRHVERERWVRVRAWRNEGSVWIEVEDNGSGISQERLREVESSLKNWKDQGRELETSVGLDNVNERIHLLCGEESELQIHMREQGCLVRIIIKSDGRRDAHDIAGSHSG